jgi:hypothetical protein
MVYSHDYFGKRYLAMWAVWKVPVCQLAGLMLNGIIGFWKLFYNLLEDVPQREE